MSIDIPCRIQLKEQNTIERRSNFSDIHITPRIVSQYMKECLKLSEKQGSAH